MAYHTIAWLCCAVLCYARWPPLPPARPSRRRGAWHRGRDARGARGTASSWAPSSYGAVATSCGRAAAAATRRGAACRRAGTSPRPRRRRAPYQTSKCSGGRHAHQEEETAEHQHARCEAMLCYAEHQHARCEAMLCYAEHQHAPVCRPIEGLRTAQHSIRAHWTHMCHDSYAMLCCAMELPTGWRRAAPPRTPHSIAQHSIA
jgi:hypothetical protein